MDVYYSFSRVCVPEVPQQVVRVPVRSYQHVSNFVFHSVSISKIIICRNQKKNPVHKSLSLNRIGTRFLFFCFLTFFKESYPIFLTQNSCSFEILITFIKILGISYSSQQIFYNLIFLLLPELKLFTFRFHAYLFSIPCISFVLKYVVYPNHIFFAKVCGSLLTV